MTRNDDEDDGDDGGDDNSHDNSIQFQKVSDFKRFQTIWFLKGLKQSDF